MARRHGRRGPAARPGARRCRSAGPRPAPWPAGRCRRASVTTTSLGVGDHVLVGDDDAVGPDDEAGAVALHHPGALGHEEEIPGRAGPAPARRGDVDGDHGAPTPARRRRRARCAGSVDGLRCGRVRGRRPARRWRHVACAAERRPAAPARRLAARRRRTAPQRRSASLRIARHAGAHAPARSASAGTARRDTRPPRSRVPAAGPAGWSRWLSPRSSRHLDVVQRAAAETDVHHRADQHAHHVVQEPVGLDVKAHAAAVGPLGPLGDRARRQR